MRANEPVNELVAGALAALAAELSQVEQEVQAVLSDLRAPFSQLVQGQMQVGLPLRRGAFVLTGAAGAADSAVLVQRRLYLAAAIEVLRLALAVHTRLLGSAEAPLTLDRSLLGSTILAGDFCFSRSAGLAAKTDSPTVVDIFAQALQRVSEGTLRGLFEPGAAVFDAERELCLAGVVAGGELAALSQQERQADQQLAALLLDRLHSPAPHPVQLPPDLLDALTPRRAARWQALQSWLKLA